jgi:hypothetical protein
MKIDASYIPLAISAIGQLVLVILIANHHGWVRPSKHARRRGPHPHAHHR